jgi:hypothetical protein
MKLKRNRQKINKNLEYPFLVVNENNQVVKTQVFKVAARDDDDPPAWQETAPEGQINMARLPMGASWRTVQPWGPTLIKRVAAAATRAVGCSLDPVIIYF